MGWAAMVGCTETPWGGTSSEHNAILSGQLPPFNVMVQVGEKWHCKHCQLPFSTANNDPGACRASPDLRHAKLDAEPDHVKLAVSWAGVEA